VPEVIAPSPAVGVMRTRGHDRAVEAVRGMIRGRAPHALLIGGPAGIGKTTLALDLAAGLLCTDPDPDARPCRACRGCRLVERGRHPDLHRLTPGGPGDQIRIGARERPEDGTVRRLAIDLVLLPVEGGARVAVVERADRMGDDAQTALLKTLEEPPAGVTIVLCADDEDRLMPTVRSRCARLRLGPVATRDIEAILADGDLADPPVAARLARLSGGRPGLARSLARSADAVAARDESARTLLDLLGQGPATRLAAARELVAAAGVYDRALSRGAAADEATDDPAPAGGDRRGTTGRSRGAAAKGAERSPAATGLEPAASVSGDAPAEDAEDEGAAATTVSAAQRRRAAATVVGLWRDLARDLLVVRLGAERDVRDPALLDDLRAASAALGEPGAAGAVPGAPADPAARELTAFLQRLDLAGEQLEANLRPELVLDTLLLAWLSAPTGPE
jgi:DNA polymerase III delta subunit-like protein